jgi:hypothetical protein
MRPSTHRPIRLCCVLDARFLEPDIEGLRPDLAIVRGCQLMPAWTEVTVDESVGGEEVLGLPRGFEPLHLTLSSPRRSMRVLGSIVQISALSVLDTGKQLTLSDAIAQQLVGHNHPRLILQTRQQPLEESLRRLGIAPGLNQDIEHNAILINGTPEIMLHALDADEDFVHMPLVTRSWPAAAWAVGETGGELLAPTAHSLIGDDDTALRQDQLNITQAEAEYVIQPNSVADDLGGKPMAVVRVGWQVHAASLGCFLAYGQRRLK